jgi:hypothetical protein
MTMAHIIFIFFCFKKSYRKPDSSVPQSIIPFSTTKCSEKKKKNLIYRISHSLRNPSRRAKQIFRKCWILICALCAPRRIYLKYSRWTVHCVAVAHSLRILARNRRSGQIPEFIFYSETFWRHFVSVFKVSFKHVKV